MATATSPSTDSKALNPNLSWLFALAAAAVGAIVVFALNPIKDYKVIFGATAAAATLLAGASTFLTPAKTLGVVGKFALAGVAVAVVFFIRGHGLVTTAANAVADKLSDATGAVVTTNDSGVGGIAKLIGSVGGVFAFFLVLFGGLAGAIIGSRLRSGKGYGLIPARRS